VAPSGTMDTCDEPPAMRLHPVHGYGSHCQHGAAGPVSKTLAQHAISCTEGYTNQLWSQPVAFIEDGELVLVVGTELMNIPLLFCEVRLEASSPSRKPVLVLTLPTKDDDFPNSEEQPNDRSNRWLFFVEGENDSVRRAFEAFGAAGAILPHIAEDYEFAANPVGMGASAVVFCGRYAVKEALPARNQFNTNEGKNMLPMDVVAKEGYIAAKVFTNRSASSSTAPSRSMMQNVKEEVAVLARVARHPNIIRLYGCFPILSCSQSQDGTSEAPAKLPETRWALGLQYCSGGDLGSAGVLTEDKAMQMMAGVLSGLAHLHYHDILHRDIKAENILLTDGHVPIVSDFGIAVHLSDTCNLQKRCGSPGYAAPELITGTGHSVKADAFSCGVLFYFLLSGRLPFAGPSVGSVLRRTLRCKVKFEKDFDQVSRPCKAFLVLLLQKKPEARISCEEALQTPWIQTHTKQEDPSPMLQPSVQDPEIKPALLNNPSLVVGNVLFEDPEIKPALLNNPSPVVGNVLFEMDQSITSHQQRYKYKQIERAPQARFFEVHDTDQLEVGEFELDDASSCGWVSIGCHSTVSAEASTASSRMNLSNRGRHPNKLVLIFLVKLLI